MNWFKENKNKITFAYILCFVSYIALNEVAFVVMYFQNANKYIYSAFAIAGVFLLIADFFFERKMFKAKGNIWLIAFLFVILISTIVNMSFGFAENLKTLAWSAISMLLLYPFAFTQNRENTVKQLKTLANVLGIISFVTVVISLWQYVMQIYFEYALPNDPACPQGFISGRLFGVFTDPNYASVFLLCVMALAVFYIVNTKSVLAKVLHIINMVLCYFYVVLSASRTAHLVCVIAVFIFAGLTLYKKLKKKNMKKWLVTGCSVLVAIVIAGTVFVSFQPVRYNMGYIPSLVVEMKDPNGSNRPIKPIDDERPDVGEDKDISNHRFEIWKDGIMLWQAAPIVGTSPRNHLKFAEKYFPDCFMVERQYSTHNGYLGLLTYTGLLGAVSILCFALGYFIYLMKKIFDKTRKYHAPSVAAMLAIIAIIAIAAFPMMMVFFINTIRELLFWLMLGYIIALLRKPEDENESQPVLYQLSTKLFSGKVKNED